MRLRLLLLLVTLPLGFAHAQGEPTPGPEPGPQPMPMLPSEPPQSVTVEPEEAHSKFETGANLGTPTILNGVLGYWGGEKFPIIARVSGMYYGDTRGAEIDLGWQIIRGENTTQYVALSIVGMQATSSFQSFFYNFAENEKDTFYGVGPSYGFNWRGLAFQFGLALGNWTTHQNYSGSAPWSTFNSSSFSAQLLVQVGYSFFW